LGLKDEINKEQVVVYRGALGTTESVSVRQLVIGDIIHIQQGDRVPADCILVEEMNITVDQTMYNNAQMSIEKSLSQEFTQDRENVVEEEMEIDNHKDNPDPFLLTGSMILTGSGKAVVCAVGNNTRLARNRQAGDLKIGGESTFLEEKLKESVAQISKYAYIIAIGIVIT